MPECWLCGCGFAWTRPPGRPGRPPLYCSDACRSAARALRQPEQRRRAGIARPSLSPAERADVARAAARARWADVDPAQRENLARTAACARWGTTPDPAAAARARDLEDARSARRAAPCSQCGRPVGHASRTTCEATQCRMARRAAAAAARHADLVARHLAMQ